jgi:hypothetical protein
VFVIASSSITEAEEIGTKFEDKKVLETQQTTTNAVIASTTNVPYHYFNNNFSVTKDGYGNKIPVGHLANSQEICSILQTPTSHFSNGCQSGA